MNDQKRLQEYDELWNQGYTKFVPELIEWARGLKECTQHATENNDRLNVFLQEKNFTEGLGMHVVDAAMLYITRLEERVQELEQHASDLNNELFSERMEKDSTRNSLNNVREQNQHYKQALEFYADEENYKADVINQWEPVIPVNRDLGEKARQALEGESE